MNTQALRIVVTGIIAQHPHLGGVAWDYLQYAAGLRELGHDVYYLEDSGEWPYTIDGGPSGQDWIAYDCTPNVQHLAQVMDRFGLGERWAYRFPIKPKWFGMPAAKRHDVLRTADLLINVSGTLKRPQDYRSVGRLAYIDSDPVFTQVKLLMPRGQIKFRKRFDAHDVYFSFGEDLGATDLSGNCHWMPTRQPIVMSQWPVRPVTRPAYTTVMSWTSYKPLRHRGRGYGQKDVEFRRFTGLPGKLPSMTFEVALSGTEHVVWESGGSAGFSGADLLRRSGWSVVNAHDVCGDIDRYRSYIQDSRAEWSVAKNGYVQGRSGWFSCRSACYLASGRPVVVQDTGFGRILPTGLGLLAFSTLDEAVAAVHDVERDYATHARAAREIAEAYFDSKKVLSGLVEQAMTAAPAMIEVGA